MFMRKWLLTGKRSNNLKLVDHISRSWRATYLNFWMNLEVSQHRIASRSASAAPLKRLWIRLFYARIFMEFLCLKFCGRMLQPLPFNSAEKKKNEKFFHSLFSLFSWESFVRCARKKWWNCWKSKRIAGGPRMLQRFVKDSEYCCLGFFYERPRARRGLPRELNGKGGLPPKSAN